MKVKFYLLLIFFLFVSNVYCKTIIITSIYPLKLIINEIAPKNVKIINVIPSNANPHLFEPTPDTSKIIEKADIFIGIQKDFDGWITKNLNKNATILFLNKSGQNPHIWLSPSIILKKLNKIKNTLIKKMPNKKEIIEENYFNFKRNLVKFLNEIRIEFANLTEKKVIEFHPAWDYLAEDTGLKIIGIISVSERGDVSLNHIIELINIAKRENVKIILASKNIYNKFLPMFSKEINAKVVYLDPVGEKEKTYFQFLENIYSKIFNSLLKVQGKILLNFSAH